MSRLIGAVSLVGFVVETIKAKAIREQAEKQREAAMELYKEVFEKHEN